MIKPNRFNLIHLVLHPGSHPPEETQRLRAAMETVARRNGMTPMAFHEESGKYRLELRTPASLPIMAAVRALKDSVKIVDEAAICTAVSWQNRFIAFSREANT